MNKLKEYTVEVIYPGRSGAEKIIADYFSWSDSGCYLFYNGTDGSVKKLIACYPILNTIIKNIKDIEQ